MIETNKISDYVGGFLLIFLWPFGIALAFWGLELIIKNFSYVDITLTLLVILSLYIINKNR